MQKIVGDKTLISSLWWICKWSVGLKQSLKRYKKQVPLQYTRDIFRLVSEYEQCYAILRLFNILLILIETVLDFSLVINALKKIRKILKISPKWKCLISPWLNHMKLMVCLECWFRSDCCLASGPTLNARGILLEE